VRLGGLSLEWGGGGGKVSIVQSHKGPPPVVTRRGGGRNLQIVETMILEMQGWKDPAAKVQVGSGKVHTEWRGRQQIKWL